MGLRHRANIRVDAKSELNQPKIQVSPLMRLSVTSVYFVLCTLIVQCTLLNLSTNQRLIRDHAQPSILHHTDHVRAPSSYAIPIQALVFCVHLQESTVIGARSSFTTSPLM